MQDDVSIMCGYAVHHDQASEKLVKCGKLHILPAGGGTLSECCTIHCSSQFQGGTGEESWASWCLGKAPFAGRRKLLHGMMIDLGLQGRSMPMMQRYSGQKIMLDVAMIFQQPECQGLTGFADQSHISTKKNTCEEGPVSCWHHHTKRLAPNAHHGIS